MTDDHKRRDRSRAVHDAVLAQVRYLLLNGQLVKAAELCACLDQDLRTIMERLPRKDVAVTNLGQAMSQLLADLPAVNAAFLDETAIATQEYAKQINQLRQETNALVVFQL